LKRNLLLETLRFQEQFADGSMFPSATWGMNAMSLMESYATQEIRSSFRLPSCFRDERYPLITGEAFHETAVTASLTERR
jgi:hypothetical protein